MRQRYGSDAGTRNRTIPVVKAQDWNERYRIGNHPWDMGHPHPLLVERLEADPELGIPSGIGSVLVPGCGRGWDAVALARAGWDVVAVDVASRAVEGAGALLAPHGGVAVVGDALDAGWIGRRFDLVFDHTFFCAIPLAERPRFGTMVRSTLREGGGVASVVFPIGRPPEEGGPPFGMSVDDLEASLGNEFALVESGPEVFVGRRRWPHRWGMWRRDRSQ